MLTTFAVDFLGGWLVTELNQFHGMGIIIFTTHGQQGGYPGCGLHLGFIDLLPEVFFVHIIGVFLKIMYD
jgi:hypothetical protein